MFRYIINFFKKEVQVGNYVFKDVVSAETLKKILQEHISEKLEQKGFRMTKDYTWVRDNKNSIRSIFKYSRTKGAQGAFAWGVCLDLVPSIDENNKVKRHRTDKSAILQVFEWAHEYSNSFVKEGNFSNGRITLWGEEETRQSVVRLYNNYEYKIMQWFDKANTIEGIMEIAYHQINIGGAYKIHHPSPKLILLFLLVHSGKLDEALVMLEELVQYDDRIKFQKDILISELTKTANTTNNSI